MRASRDCGSIIYHSFIFKPVPINCIGVYHSMGFPGGSGGKASACSAGDTGSIPGLGRSLEKEVATHSSNLAWKIPWTEEPGGLQSMGSQRVGHDWVTSFFHILLYVWCSPRKLFHPGKILDWKITKFVGWMIAEVRISAALFPLLQRAGSHCLFTAQTLHAFRLIHLIDC